MEEDAKDFCGHREQDTQSKPHNFHGKGSLLKAAQGQPHFRGSSTFEQYSCKDMSYLSLMCQRNTGWLVGASS